MGWRSILTLAAALLAVAPAASRSAQDDDPLGFFAPTVRLSDSDRQRLQHGDVVFDTLPASGHELALLAAGPTTATADQLVGAVKDIVRLKRGEFVPQIAVFSSPPRLEDAAGLTLDDVDLEAIRRCRPDSCDLKLTPREIDQLRAATGRGGADARPAVERAFREVLVERATTYTSRGPAGLSDGADGDPDHRAVFAELVRHSAFLEKLPNILEYFRRYPDPAAGIDSFLYWSKETLASKPIISITHVAIVRPARRAGYPDVLVISREIFSTRYTSGALAVTALVPGGGGTTPRLVYVNRTWIDGLKWLWRPFVDWRAKRMGPGLFVDAKTRIEQWMR